MNQTLELPTACWLDRKEFTYAQTIPNGDILPQSDRVQDYPQRTVRGQIDWLDFLCMTLSFSIPSRFIPSLFLTF